MSTQADTPKKRHTHAHTRKSRYAQAQASRPVCAWCQHPDTDRVSQTQRRCCLCGRLSEAHAAVEFIAGFQASDMRAVVWRTERSGT